MSNIVEVKDLSHSYNGVDWAIRDINFSIASNGVFGLLGSNGAGKSTTMNIICNVLTQTDGKVFLNGIDLRKDTIDAKKNLGFLPQTAPLHPELTVDDYLYHCADIRLIPKNKIPDAVERVKQKCSIAHFSNRIIGNLSGGYKQRVGIAQAIVHNPPFVVLDEPTNGLDPIQILEIRNLVRDIAKTRAVLVSTHILPEVQAMCDYIIMIEQGNMVFSGSIGQFSGYLEPSAILAIMHNPPADTRLMEIDGIECVERLTRTRIRIHFRGNDSVYEHIVTAAVREGWELRELTMEKESLDKVFAKLSKKSLQ